MTRDRQRATGPTTPMAIDYVILTCEACGIRRRHDADPPIVGGVQLRLWFAAAAQPCECGARTWQLKAHVIGTEHVGPEI